LQLLRAAKAHAALTGRDHVLPEDVQHLGPAILTHRVLLSGEAQLARRSAADIVAEVLSTTSVPTA